MHDPHHVHLDLDVINNDYKHDGSPPYLRFVEIRNTPFLDGDSSEYFCSIVRFTIQTGNTLPVIIHSDCQPDGSKHYDMYSILYISRRLVVDNKEFVFDGAHI